jgi:hypothetical protein
MAEKAAQQSKIQQANQPEVEQTEAPESSYSGPFADLLHLQRSAGNHAVSELLKSSGQPLDTVTRARMEAGFRADFGNVRLHTGAEASFTAREIDAAAYTVGEDIVLNRDFYRPDTAAGSQLLAHELAHVVQQRHTGTVAGISQPGDAAEIHADTAAGALIGGLGGGLGALSTTSGPVPAVQRQPTADATDRAAEQDELAEKDQQTAEKVYDDYRKLDKSIPAMIEHATKLDELFKETPLEMRRTKKAISIVMMVIYRNLKREEENAQRDPDDNALLVKVSKPGAALSLNPRNPEPVKPWTEARPKSVEDIPAFQNMVVYVIFSDLAHLAIFDDGSEYGAAEQILANREQNEEKPPPPQPDEDTEPDKPDSTSLEAVGVSTLVAGNGDYFKQEENIVFSFSNYLSLAVRLGYKLPRWDWGKRKEHYSLTFGLPPLYKPKLGTESPWALSVGTFYLTLGVDIARDPKQKPEPKALFQIAVDPAKIYYDIPINERLQVPIGGKVSISIANSGEVQGKLEVGAGLKGKTLEVFTGYVGSA